MNKVISGLAVLATFVLLVGCRSTTSTSQPTPSHYWTALEAYEQIRPAMLDWHKDAIATDVDSLLPSTSPERRVQSNGKAPVWSFEVVSPNAEKLTIIYLTDGVVEVGIDRLEGKEIPFFDTGERLPVNHMIDSDQVVNIASKYGVNADYVLLRMRTAVYGDDQDGNTLLVWVLTYAEPDNLSQEYRVLIDIITGEVVHDDFTYTPPPPTSTPIREARPDQLLIRAYGEFDLYITNPQGQSLGIEPDSGEPITEIPDAGYDPDSDVMTEDSIHLASALIMNPVEGRYRVQLHGLGEPEKRCRWSVEIRKGTGEEMLREVEIPCQEGVSLVYEFTLSLSGEELLSDVTPVEE